MIDVSYTDVFKKHLRRLSKRYRSIQKDLDPIVDELKSGNVLGDRIVGVQEVVYKVRIKNSDNHKGKSGGYRLLYYMKVSSEIRLMAIYSKSDQLSLTAEGIGRILRDE